jgi:hypothetical protein
MRRSYFFKRNTGANDIHMSSSSSLRLAPLLPEAVHHACHAKTTAYRRSGLAMQNQNSTPIPA